MDIFGICNRNSNKVIVSENESEHMSQQQFFKLVTLSHMARVLHDPTTDNKSLV